MYLIYPQPSYFFAIHVFHITRVDLTSLLKYTHVYYASIYMSIHLRHQYAFNVFQCVSRFSPSPAPIILPHSLPYQDYSPSPSKSSESSVRLHPQNLQRVAFNTLRCAISPASKQDFTTVAWISPSSSVYFTFSSVHFTFSNQ